MIKKCSNCGKEEENHAKNLCFNCYRKYAWNRKKIICKRCGRSLSNHAKGFCAGCYNFLFNLEKTKASNYKRWYGISLDVYKKFTQKCVICGFDKIVDLHHIDENNKNNSEENLIGLCPNHHKMLHNFRYRKEIFNLLIEKGYKLPENIKLSFSIDNCKN